MVQPPLFLAIRGREKIQFQITSPDLWSTIASEMRQECVG